MRLILVHGIKQENRSSDWIKQQWLDEICQSLSQADQSVVRSLDVDAPFYGKLLYDHTKGLAAADKNLTPQSAADVEGDEAAFYRDVLTEVITSPETSIDPDTVDPEADVIPMGVSPHNRYLIALVRALEATSPAQGKVLLRLLPQAFAYLNRVQATEAVDKAVRPAFDKPGPAIVVGHSLGSVVAFKLMRECGFVAPLYLTIGSPLAIKAVQGPLRAPLGRRPAVETWHNAFDVDDFVTLGRPLSPETFGSGIENHAVANPGPDAHSHAGYLGQRSIGNLICNAVRYAS